MLITLLWACLGAVHLGQKTASGQIYGFEPASWESTPLQAAPRLGLRALEGESVSAPPVGANWGVVEASVTSGGTANAATVPGLKGQLAAESLANIAAQDARLAKAVSGDGGKRNFSVGSGTAAEANQLGKTWVGDGAQLVADQVGCPGCWKSADGLRITDRQLLRMPRRHSTQPGFKRTL
jgi:hypothetical protein